MRIGKYAFRYRESAGWWTAWDCPFCGSQGPRAFLGWLFYGTRKLHRCKSEAPNVTE